MSVFGLNTDLTDYLTSLRAIQRNATRSVVRRWKTGLHHDFYSRASSGSVQLAFALFDLDLARLPHVRDVSSRGFSDDARRLRRSSAVFSRGLHGTLRGTS